MAYQTPVREVFASVDTHADTHAAVIDVLGRHLGDLEFPTTPTGYRGLLTWVRGFGTVAVTGIEGTGAYGAELGRVMTAAAEVVIEVNRPDRSQRRMNGKSDPLDAYAAAQALPPVGPVGRSNRATGSWSRSGVCGWLGARRSKPRRRPSTRSGRC